MVRHASSVLAFAWSTFDRIPCASAQLRCRGQQAEVCVRSCTWRTCLDGLVTASQLLLQPTQLRLGLFKKASVLLHFLSCKFSALPPSSVSPLGNDGAL